MDCECGKETPTLEVETEDAIYEIIFGQIQIEITGRCNLNCQHCRAGQSENKDMPIDQIMKIVRFGRQFSPNYKEIVVSGGEPLLHKDFFEVMRRIREFGSFVTLTTNGLLFSQQHLELFRELNFERLSFSVSIDNIDPAKHDAFRGQTGVFKKAIHALQMASDAKIPGVVVSMRSTIQAYQIPEMEKIAKMAQELSCTRMGFSAIHPSGKAMQRPDLWMNKEEKRQFIGEVYRLKTLFPGMNITTNDPLKCLVRGSNEIGEDGEVIFDGCCAGSVTFNVFSDGTMTPCSLLNIPMMNVTNMTIAEITEAYRTNEIVKQMLTMNLTGKCGICSKKFACGGCRARAFGETGDYLAEDPHCWL